MVALVAALLTQGLLVGVDKPTVPRLEVSGVVNVECLLDVSDSKVIKLDSGDKVSGQGHRLFVAATM